MHCLGKTHKPARFLVLLDERIDAFEVEECARKVQKREAVCVVESARQHVPTRMARVAGARRVTSAAARSMPKYMNAFQ